jgi:hypothetical protein
MNRRLRQALERRLATLAEKADAGRRVLASTWQRGRCLFRTDPLTIRQALAHPMSGESAREALAGNHGAAHGIGQRLLTQCWGCNGRSRRDWKSALVLVISLDDEAGGIKLLSRQCTAPGGEDAGRFVLRGIERDSGLRNGQRVPASAFVPQVGRA